jgi:2-iminobutanoate/2-iminopropanoate deaminase
VSALSTWPTGDCTQPASTRYNRDSLSAMLLLSRVPWDGVPKRKDSVRTIVSTPDAPKAIGPYSQATKANGLIFASGQIAIDPATQQVINGDISAQTERVMKNISGILTAAGSELKNVLRCTVFLKSMDDFAAMNAVYGKYFDSNPPARSTVEVSRLPKDVLVEIDVIALAE